MCAALFFDGLSAGMRIYRFLCRKFSLNGGSSFPAPEKRNESMLIGKVVGYVVSTRKCDNLVGNKFMIVEPIPSLKIDNRIVAVDKVGAGIGELVLVAQGSAARVGCGVENAPIDAAIVGIIDEGQNLEI